MVRRGLGEVLIGRDAADIDEHAGHLVEEEREALRGAAVIGARREAAMHARQ
jgi:hypothetical protein